MVQQFPGLPDSDHLDIAAFSRLFDDKATSYKFLFFLALLNVLSKQFFNPQNPIELKSLLIEMLVIAWYPHSAFRLSFGSQDKITLKLDSLNLEIKKALLEITEGDMKYLRDQILTRERELDEKPIKELMRYVPFRLIRPFFSKETEGIDDHKVKNQIIALAEELFYIKKPLYKFTSDGNSIEIHPEWLKYVKTYYKILHGWASWKFLEYMQAKNPSMPGIVNKIFPPEESRKAMPEQTKFWKTVITHSSKKITCIYSGIELNTENLSLDHFLPWRFVAHNQLWNLIPVPKNVNSSKSDRIPDALYLEELAKVQHTGLTVAREYVSAKFWNRCIESYIVDFQFSEDELLNFDIFCQKYLNQIKPRMDLAVSYGLEGSWVYQR